MNQASFTETFWQEDSFRFVKPEEFEDLGIDPGDIAPGTLAALKHPSQLLSRFGGNAYGFGIIEFHDRLKSKDFRFLQSLTLEDPEEIKLHYKRINEIYSQIGLLIRFTERGTPYYLIPLHLVSTTRIRIKAKIDEISKVISFHRRKFLKEQHEIGVIAQQDDLIVHEIFLRFKEHRFVILDSLERLQDVRQTFDMVILPRDLYEILLTEKFSPLPSEGLSRKRLEQYATYTLWKIFNLLKEDGELFIVGNHYAPAGNRTVRVVFNSVEEEKNFLLFNHIFKTKKKYRIVDNAVDVNVFDFQKYLGGVYVEQELVGRLLHRKTLEGMSLEEVDSLPYLNFPLNDLPFLGDQEKVWSRLLSTFFEKIFLRPLVPPSVKEDWEKRFSCDEYDPHYMKIYLGQKRRLRTTTAELKLDVLGSGLSGCPPDFLADYRNSFDYLIRILRVLERLKGGDYRLPQVFLDRLEQPLESKKRRFHALNDVIKLINKVGRLEKIRDDLNPDRIEGPKTSVLDNLEALTFFGFTYNELREITFMVLGHTPMGRIISGKMSEKTLKPLSDLARAYDPQDALNLLRYCRLMTMAEMEASRDSELSQEQLAELFDLYESTVRVVFTRDLDWDRLMDEKISSMGGIHHMIVRKLLKMINHFEFLDNWSELREKGRMEKQSLADYDERKLSRIENVIQIVNTIEQFEEKYLKSDPLELPVFYRKILDIEFHGTGHLFERMDSRLVFILLWIAVNVTRNEVINFNPILSDRDSLEVDDRLRKVEQEARAVNIHYLELEILKKFSEELYANKSSFIVGTGFQLKVDVEAQSLSITYMDMDKNLGKLEALSRRLAGKRLAEISNENLRALETLFSSLESFYQSHIQLMTRTDLSLKLPDRQKSWFQKAQGLRKYLKEELLKVIFLPEDIFTDLQQLYSNAPTLLSFVLPEFMALRDLDISGHLYLESPVTQYIIATARKLQALIRHERENFQDIQHLHRLAQREFGPMATGIVGVSEPQIEELEGIVERLSSNKPLIKALTTSLVFRDIGRIPSMREKHRDEINPSDVAYSGALILEKEMIPEKYHLDPQTKEYLIFLVRRHGLLYHVLWGEVSMSGLEGLLAELGDQKDLFDALFLLSFIMISSISEELILEDLANRLFLIRAMSRRIMDGETTLAAQEEEMFKERGNIFYALEAYRVEGLPEGITSAHYLQCERLKEAEKSKCLEAGRMLLSVERLFRLRGLRYVGFIDLANLMLKVPLKFIYKKRKFSSIGYATFEKEVYEAFRLYNTLGNLPEPIRHFILEQLAGDRVRVFGFEKVSGYLSYENQVKLMLIALLGTGKFNKGDEPISIDFQGMGEKIENRYEALNDCLNGLPTAKIWGSRQRLNSFFKSKTGIVLKKENFHGVLSVAFVDRMNVEQKISYMQTINTVEQLKNYFHYSLQSFRKYPFYTEDYERRLEEAYERRLVEITDMILTRTKKQMDLINDFKGLHNLVSDLLERSLDIGFSEDQKHRLNDLYELRKDGLRREKVEEIEAIMEAIRDPHELNDYWESIKWYLQSNRPFFGKEFEYLIARRFDEAMKELEELKIKTG